jgi:NADH-quinone oxidoreductase subunit H
LRIDQLMSLCWKYLTPASLVLIILCGAWKVLVS